MTIAVLAVGVATGRQWFPALWPLAEAHFWTGCEGIADRPESPAFGPYLTGLRAWLDAGIRTASRDPAQQAFARILGRLGVKFRTRGVG